MENDLLTGMALPPLLLPPLLLLLLLPIPFACALLPIEAAGPLIDGNVDVNSGFSISTVNAKKKKDFDVYGCVVKFYGWKQK